jgi:UDP-N-acetyl-D-galactosamine dehydrogenase
MNSRIVVLGLGYVGLPLLVQLSKHFHATGFDINVGRVQELASGIDRTNECEPAELTGLLLTVDPAIIAQANVVIVTVPTPITGANVPDLTPMIKATEMIAKHLAPGTTVIYESTVYPGVTEEICVPLLEKSGLKQGQFFVGYSPERINPGDRINTLTTVTKIVAGDTPRTLDLVDGIYSKITKTHRAESIKVAEAAKVIENTQRDVNIALMNELSHIFTRLGVDTHDVINAAGTKWNFLKFYPGFVGGHCISVDPYYLTHRAEEAGYIPSLILAAREVNDQMPTLMKDLTLKALMKQKVLTPDTMITVLGITFKENVPDVRNSKVAKLVKDLQDWGVQVQVFDPHADAIEVQHEYGITLTERVDLQPADAVILAVSHDAFIRGGWSFINTLLKTGRTVVTDIKGALPRPAQPDTILLVRP